MSAAKRCMKNAGILPGRDEIARNSTGRDSGREPRRMRATTRETVFPQGTKPPAAALLVAQCLDRVESGRSPCRPDAEKETDSDAERGREPDRLRRYEDLPAGESRHEPRGTRAEADAEQASEEAKRHGLDEELQKDAPPRRAERHADADLARALGDADEHDVHDADAADDQAHARDAREQQREGLLGFLLSLEKVAPIDDCEIVRISGPQPVLLAQHALDVDHRALERYAVQIGRASCRDGGERG